MNSRPQLIDASERTFALTLTLKQKNQVVTDRGVHYHKLTKQDCMHTAKRFQSKLNQFIFKHGATRHGRKLKYMVTVESDGVTKNYHLHYAIGGVPEHIKLDQFEQLVIKAKKYVREIDQQQTLVTVSEVD